VGELRHRLDAGDELFLLDVRESFEYDIARIEGSQLIPLGDLNQRMGELAKSKEIVVLCKSGARSATAVDILRRSGFAKAFNLEGGIDAWADQIDPTMQKY
jgi:adenylyltransferase/sulfurtransferase